MPLRCAVCTTPQMLCVSMEETDYNEQCGTQRMLITDKAIGDDVTAQIQKRVENETAEYEPCRLSTVVLDVL